MGRRFRTPLLFSDAASREILIFFARHEIKSLFGAPDAKMGDCPPEQQDSKRRNPTPCRAWTAQSLDKAWIR